MNMRQQSTNNQRIEDLLSEADNLISAALGIATGPQGYCTFIAARDDFRRRIITELSEQNKIPGELRT